MELELRINGVIKSLDVAPNESLLAVLRREGYQSVKHGCESGECGACTVLVDGVARPSCVMLALQAGGATLTTVEGLGSMRRLHPLQETFIDAGAVHCGFCTPGMLLSAHALLQRNADPSEEEVRAALSGNLCRCGGYVRAVQAVLRAAALLRGEDVEPISIPDSGERLRPWEPGERAESRGDLSSTERHVIGRAERKVDALKLVTGKPAFSDDLVLPGMLHARLLTSPHAHALIRAIDVTEARALPGVHAVLTYRDVPRVPYTSAGLDWPEPGPHDQYSLDHIVRFVGDRVAAVAAETPEIAEQALKLIKVDYEILPALLDPRQASDASAPHLHSEPESSGIYDASRNIAVHVHAERGNVERGFSEADLVVEDEYVLPQIQQVPLENHTVITWWDEDDRLVVRSSTEVPYQVRRLIAPVIGLPPRRIRVVRPRIGGSFGAKQHVLLEDICALLTLATDRPVRLEYTREEEFQSGRSSPAQIIRLKTGLQRDGTLVANQMMVLVNAGAYGGQALIAQSESGIEALSLYPCPHLRFVADAVYTNLPPAGLFRGNGALQSFFALESHMDEIARRLGIDPLELRRKNWLKDGEALPPLQRAEAGSQSHRRSPRARDGLEQCLRIVEEQLDWSQRRGHERTGRLRRGVGIALTMAGSGGSSAGTSSARIALNDDGSFSLLVGASESGSGADTLLAQIAADVLGVRTEDIVIQAADTDSGLFDTGGDAAAKIHISGGAVKRAAEQVRAQILAVAARMLQSTAERLTIAEGIITAPGGGAVSVSQVALQALYREQQPIMASASWASQETALSFAVQGAEVEVDVETGAARVLKLITAVDGGRAINPVLAQGEIEGGATLGLGYALCEELYYDQQGKLLTRNLSDYRILNTADMPPLETYLVETDDSAGPFGAGSVLEVALAGVAPAVANAVADATGVRLRRLPLTPERVLRALHAAKQQAGR
jgi:putative selenate reductase molybdopterin-binding subunit